MNYSLLSKLYYKNKDTYMCAYENRYNNESTIKFDLQISKNPAFLTCSFELLNLISSIYRLDKRLENLANRLPGIALEQFTVKCLIDEISLTNEIEGVQSTRKEINDILVEKNITKSNQRLFGLVKKYQLLSAQDLQINSCEDIRKIYDELVLKEITADNPDNIPDGLFFRQNSVNVQNQHFKSIHRGIVPEQAIIEYMNKALKILHDDSIEILIRISLFHYLFGYIHPFYDGNGRTSRFISSYLLSQELHPLVSYSLSYTIKKNIHLYYNAFKYSNDPKNNGDLTPFILIFLEILQEAVSDLCEILTNKIEDFENLSRQLETLVPPRIMDILYILLQNTLFGEKGLSVYDIHDITHMSLPKIRTVLKESSEYLVVTKDGKVNNYQIDLEKVNE